MKNEPNNAMEPTPVAVTVPAYAGTAPSTSAAHLERQAERYMFIEYFEAAEEHLQTNGIAATIRPGTPVSVAELNAIEREVRRPIPPELRSFFIEMGDGYDFSPAPDAEGFMIGHLGDYRYKVAGFDQVIRSEVQDEKRLRNPKEVVSREARRRERWFPFYNFGGGGYMLCLDLNEVPSPVRYWECVCWPNMSPNTWDFRLADSFTEFVKNWSRFCFTEPTGDSLINFSSGATGRYDWAPSRFDPKYDRGTSEVSSSS